MKKENVKFVLESSAGCVVDHTYDSEIENSSNSEEEEDEEEEIESEYHDNIPIIMTTNKKRKDQHCIWKGSVFQGAVETEDTQFLGENFHTDNTDIESPFYYFRRFFIKKWYSQYQITLIFKVHNAIWIKVTLEQVKLK